MVKLKREEVTEPQTGDAVTRANDLALKRLSETEPTLVGVGRAVDVIPGMDSRTLLHSGPPIAWERMQGPTRMALLGAMVYEGWAKDRDDAVLKLSAGYAVLGACHDHDAVGPMAGVISPSMPVFIVADAHEGNAKAFVTLNEGLGMVLRYGGWGSEVLARLKWMETSLAPALAAAVQDLGPVDLKSILVGALTRGDECHNRSKAATALFLQKVAPPLVTTSFDRPEIRKILEFLAGNEHFFLNLSMASAKVMTMRMATVERSSLVTAMASNGVEFGIRVAGLGSKWYLAPAPHVDAKYFKGYTREDASPVLGDSAIVETVGLGAFALAAAPAIISFIGGTADLALELTARMRRICHDVSPDFKIPYLGYEGTPTGIDIRKVCGTGIVPVMDVGVAHREPGKGQVGAGLTSAPLACFSQACMDFDRLAA